MLFHHDDRSSVNVDNLRLVEKLALPTLPHPKPYKLQWLSKKGKLVVDMLEEYKGIFPKEMSQGLPPLRGIEHHIDLTVSASLPNKHAYRVNLEESKEIQKQVEKLLEKGWHKQGKVNIVANALSKRHVLLAMLKTKLLGFECVKELYIEDDDFKETNKLCANSANGDFFRHEGLNEDGLSKAQFVKKLYERAWSHVEEKGANLCRSLQGHNPIKPNHVYRKPEWEGLV
ncbi:hypothetical protein CR513_16026, partial [Mucuna pruriens]